MARFTSSQAAQILQAWSQFPTDRAELQRVLQALPWPDTAWGITLPDARVGFEQRWDWLLRAEPHLRQFFTQRQFPDTWILPLWSVWFPLAAQLQSWRSADPDATGAQIIGFLGGQGSGKTTLTHLLKCLLELQGLRVMAWSIDDLYLPYADRLALQQQDPRLIWRGPPGTHDVPLGLQVLRQFQAGKSVVQVPRFDKSCHGGAGDRSGFEPVEPVDLVLFEGWFVGVHPLPPLTFEQPDLPPPLVTASDRAYARDMNLALHDYMPLWTLLDRLIVMQLQDYRWSQQWRQQAEQQMRATGVAGMTDLEIQRFVEFFWKTLHPELFVTPLTQEPGWADWVLDIGADHLPDRLYRPGT